MGEIRVLFLGILPCHDVDLVNNMAMVLLLQKIWSPRILDLGETEDSWLLTTCNTHCNEKFWKLGFLYYTESQDATRTVHASHLKAVACLDGF